MKKFISELRLLYAETEVQEAIKLAILSIVQVSSPMEVENLLSDALSKNLAPDDRAYVEKIYKILDKSVVTKKLMIQFGLN